MVSSGHYLASVAAQQIFQQGGNAIDAGIAAGLALNVVLPEWTSIGGVAPILVYEPRSGSVVSLCGLGRWPRATDVEELRRQGNGRIPTGVLRCVTPAAMGAWLTALLRFGRLRLEQVFAPALELAERGIPVHGGLRRALATIRNGQDHWASTRETFLPDGRVPEEGTLLRQPQLAATLRQLMDAARKHTSRERGIEAAYVCFYQGDIARRLAEFFEREGGWLRFEDLAEFEVTVEEALRTEYRGYEICACGPWCQGPLVQQALNLLALEDVQAMGHNSAAYIHFVVEALKLCFADRGAYYGDPDWVAVPLAGLLSSGYAAAQRARIDLRRCFDGEPPPGDPWRFEREGARAPDSYGAPAALDSGTSYVCTVDDEGNAFSATPSCGIQNAPVVPGLGFPASGRGSMSWLDEAHPSAVQPGKRPFLTPNPGLALKDGQFFLAYGTPGLDTQPQAMVQLLANVVDFGMDLQEAVEAPRFATYSFRRADDPHAYEPNALYLEDRIDTAIGRDLAVLGHDVRSWPAFAFEAGALCAIRADWPNRTLIGAADPRRLCYAMGW
jgi:gamma-glutamyltranspeptidase/glutathione hydrolase